MSTFIAVTGLMLMTMWFCVGVIVGMGIEREKGQIMTRTTILFGPPGH